MKFLHTSDWHLGKTLFNHSLIEDQKIFLDQIVKELCKAEVDKDSYDALIVAGDIYDKAIPTIEATKLFSNFLKEVHDKFPKLQMFFSSGNHDSATRLSFASSLLSYQNIHIATDANECDKGILVGDKDNGTAAVVYQIPFVQPGTLLDSENNVLKHQEELIQEACKRIKNAHVKYKKNKIPSIVTAHIFAGHSNLSGSERCFVGTAEQVKYENFLDFDYVALGHIHGKQNVHGEKICYSGSPLSYNFGEKSDKVMFSVTVSTGKIEKKEIPFIPLHKVTRIEDTYENFLGDKYDENKYDYLEFICIDKTVHENPLDILRGKFLNLLSFRVARDEVTGQNMAIAERKKALENIVMGDYGKLFDLFMNDIYKNSSDENDLEVYKNEKKIFIEIAKENQIEE